MKQIEVNGMLLEFDEKLLLKQEIRVGDNVQVLKKSYSSWECYAGVVTQLLPFADKPAMEIMYLENSYSSCEIKKLVIVQGAESEDAPRVVKMDDKFLPFTKERCIDLLQKDITEKENKLEEAKLKLEYFLKYFNHYFEEIQKDREDNENGIM